jgi:hypothetical protein
MKIISLFTKAPTHQRFSYRPRYYDPTKDEMAERESRIKKEIERERGVVAIEEQSTYRSRITGSFQAARKRSKSTTETSAVLVRFGAILFMVLLLFAFLEWGKPALYGAFLAIPIYFYMKYRDIKKS